MEETFVQRGEDKQDERGAGDEKAKKDQKLKIWKWTQSQSALNIELTVLWNKECLPAGKGGHRRRKKSL